MSYVKNYNVGQIKVDLPTPNFSHELPLFSFGDIHGKLNVSLNFNYASKRRGDNSYYIADGYKLNLHKRIITSLSGEPQSFENENGSTVSLEATNDVFTFDDETQRIIRKVGDTYELENPDYSKEVYNNSGRLTAVYDKYGVLILSYGYASSWKPNYIVYRGSKRIDFVYNSSGMLYEIKYNNSSIVFRYESDMVKVSHYNGVTFDLTSTWDKFIATATATENATTFNYTTKIERPTNNLYTLKVSDLVGDDIVNEMTYVFSDTIVNDYDTPINCLNKHSQVELIDKKGVKTRTQYFDKYPLYSYEINDNGEYAEGDINIFNTLDGWNFNDVAGVVNKNTGIDMYVSNVGTQTWLHNAFDYNNDRVGDYFLVTGWIRSKNGNLTPVDIHIKGGIYETYFTPAIAPAGQWKYFAYRFKMSANDIYVYPWDTSLVELKDLKIIFNSKDERFNSAMNICSAPSYDVLVYHGGDNYEYLPINDSDFLCGDENILNYGRIYFDDILKYKLNRKKNCHTNEVYYNNCSKILYSNSSNPLKVMYNDIAYNIDNFYLGKRQYNAAGAEITTILKEGTYNFLICQVIDENGSVVSSKIINDKLDVDSSTVDGITTRYARENDLIVSSEITSDTNIDVTFTRRRAYGVDANNCPTITDTDEFENVTVYTLDPIWGNIKSVTLPDGQIVTDEFDSGACAKTSRTFASDGRSNTYEYFGGNLSKVQSGGLNYDFSYTKGELSSIQKNSALIEEHESTDTQENSYYPSKTGAIYSDEAIFDKYGRLTSVDGVLTNTYSANAEYVSGQYIASGNNDASSKLATSTDHITGNVTKFAYDENQLTHAAVFNSSGSKIGEESIVYDKIGRVTSDEYVYGSNIIKETRSYVTSETSVNADKRINHYECWINGYVRSLSNNSYDSFKRLNIKSLNVGDNQVIKTFSYGNTRLNGIRHTKNGATMHNYTWNYDSQSRVTSEADTVSGGYTNSYVYDNYGQLFRENNAHLGKTILYTYDNVGNITKAQKYNYTTGDVSGAPVEDTYTYSTSYPDRLSSFNNKSIIYDNNGCVKTYDGWTYTWHKGKLSAMAKNTANSASSVSKALVIGTSHGYTFKYNALGQRTEKKYTYFPGSIQTIDYMVSCTTTYEYDLQGRLLSDTRVMKYNDGTYITNQFVFIYEESEIVGVVFTNPNGTGVYYYDKNPRGDVIAILDNSGNTVVKYKYDAFGNCDCYYSMNNDLSNGNPIRYRSYYYDNDTGFYYLNARYYNPEWRRFISPARTSAINIDTVNGLNLYGYANNNPICINYKNNYANGINSISIDKASFNSKIGFMVASSSLDAFSPKAFSIHVKSELLSTDWPSFFTFTTSKTALVDWEISIYKRSLNFDAAEIHSFYVSLGNLSAFAGYNIEEGKFGVFADANVLSAGYDGRYIDAGISVVGVGFILGWEDKKFRFKFDPPGWFGFDVSIDFGQIIKDFFGWEW